MVAESSTEPVSSASVAARSPILFMFLVLLLSIPFYFLTDISLLPRDMYFFPASALMVWVPVTVASGLTFHESGLRGVRELLRRGFDVRKIRSLVWFIPILFLLPLCLYISYLATDAFVRPLPDPTPLWDNPLRNLGMFLFLLIPFAFGEEVGWMGYAADPLQERWGTLPASFALGAFWAIWHVVPWFLLRDGMIVWILSSCVVSIVLRQLLFWIYNGTHGSVFACIIFHATFNISYRLFPDQGSMYDPTVTAAVLILVTGLIMWFARSSRVQAH